MPSSKDLNALSETAPAFSSFRIEKARGKNIKTRQRAKFSLARKKEVSQVRKDRACLRCSLLKISCSSGPICATCKALVFHMHEKKTMSFSGCVRTYLVEVSVFERVMRREPLRVQKPLKREKYGLPPDFSNLIHWNLSTLVEYFLDGMTRTFNPVIESLGFMSTPAFADLVEPYIGRETIMIFQFMLDLRNISSNYKPRALLEFAPQIFDSIKYIHLRPAAGGHRFLELLDDAFRPQSWSNSTKERAQTLLLLAIGTIFAIGWAGRLQLGYHTFCMPGDTEREIQQEQQMADHSCQILAHHIIYIASRLGVYFSAQQQKFILEHASTLWTANDTSERIDATDKFTASD